MSSLLKKILFSAIAIVIALLPLAPTAAMTVSPVLLDYQIAPGASRQGLATLINDSKETKTYTLSAENFIARGEDGEQQYLVEAQPTGLASWIHVDQPTVTLEPGTSREFPFLIVVPPNAEPGGHYATLFFSQAGGSLGGGSGVGVAEQVGVLLLVNVPGNIHEALQVDSFRVTGPSMANRLPILFETRLKNTGSVHERPVGTITIQNGFGNVVARIPMNPTNAAILPSSIRRMASTWSASAPLRHGGFVSEIVNEWTHFGFGKYTATISANYGAQQAHLQGTSVSFWILPWHLMIVAAIIVALLIVLISLYNQMIIRAAIAKGNTNVKQGRKRVTHRS